MAPVVGVNRNIGNSPRHECRSDIAHGEALEGLRIESRRDVGAVVLRREYQ